MVALAVAVTFTKIHPWLPWPCVPPGVAMRCPRFQDDSDDSDREVERGSPRHSWYTANRKRGGHASDVNHSTPSTRAAALTKARAAEHPPSAPQTGAPPVGGGETALPVDEPQTTGTDTATAAAATAGGGRGGGGLPNAVSARQHRSPSWYRQTQGGEGGDAEEAAAAEAGLSGARGSTAAAGGTDCTEGDPEGAARGGGGSGSGMQTSSNTMPRTGGVSARLHHSPSRILRGGATLCGEGVGDAAGATVAAEAARTPPSTKAVAAAGKKKSTREAAAATPVASSGNQKRGVNHSRTAEARSAAITSQWSPRQQKRSTGSADRPGSPQGGREGTPVTRTRSGATVDTKNGGGAVRESAATTVTQSHERAARAPGGTASRVGMQHKRGKEGPGSGQTRIMGHSQQQGPVCKNPPGSKSSKSNSSNGVQRAAKAVADTRRQQPPVYSSSGSSSGLLSSGIPSSLQNHKPFSRRPHNGRRSLSEGVMIGRGRSTPLRPSFFVSLPEEEEPAPQPPPPPPVALGGRRPSVGPVNPRAMYGHVPPPPPDEQPKGCVDRKPSSVSLSAQPPRDGGDGGGSAAHSSVKTHKVSGVAVTRSSSMAGSSSGGGGVGRHRAAAKDRRRTEQIRGSRSESAMSALSERKGRHGSREELDSNNHGHATATGRRVPGKNVGVVSSSPNVLSDPTASQGMIKVEKIQLVLNKSDGGGDARGGRSNAGPVTGAFAPPANSKTGWRGAAARDTAAGVEFAESSAQELRKLAAATAAARQESSASSGEEGGGGSGEAAEAENVDGRLSRTREGGSSTEAMPWEQQLRTMAGVGNTTRRQRGGAGHRKQSSRDMETGGGHGGGGGGRGEGRGGGGGGGGGGGRAVDHVSGETQAKVRVQR